MIVQFIFTNQVQSHSESGICGTMLWLCSPKCRVFPFMNRPTQSCIRAASNSSPNLTMPELPQVPSLLSIVVHQSFSIRVRRSWLQPLIPLPSPISAFIYPEWKVGSLAATRIKQESAATPRLSCLAPHPHLPRGKEISGYRHDYQQPLPTSFTSRQASQI